MIDMIDTYMIHYFLCKYFVFIIWFVSFVSFMGQRVFLGF